MQSRCEMVFQALPPLGSDEYLAHIQSAPTEALPPQVLVKAFRQLPPGTEASSATLLRLVRRQGKSWDHFGPLVAFAKRQIQMTKRDDYEDLVQDALQRIVSTLPTPRGEFAERAWHAFCRRELIDAWRERYGRRGERLPFETPEEFSDRDDHDEVVPLPADPPPWSASVKKSHVPRIEEIAHRVISEIQDEFVREVASATWFNSKRPKVSGRQKRNLETPLTIAFANKSRFQIKRALRHADAQLAAALLAEPGVEWANDLQALLKKLKANSSDPVGLAQERKQ